LPPLVLPLLLFSQLRVLQRSGLHHAARAWGVEVPRGATRRLTGAALPLLLPLLLLCRAWRCRGGLKTLFFPVCGIPALLSAAMCAWARCEKC
jgi:hypothetical protein